jgi:hypothetical protein
LAIQRKRKTNDEETSVPLYIIFSRVKKLICHGIVSLLINAKVHTGENSQHSQKEKRIFTRRLKEAQRGNSHKRHYLYWLCKLLHPVSPIFSNWLRAVIFRNTDSGRISFSHLTSLSLSQSERERESAVQLPASVIKKWLHKLPV